MTTCILGKNAIGKTKVLLDMYEADKSTKVIEDFAVLDGEDIKLSRESIKIIEDALEIPSILCNSQDTEIIGLVDREVSKTFLKRLTILAKDRNTIYIDEPEKGLINMEPIWMFKAIVEIGKYTDVCITTHSEEILVYEDFVKLYTVEEVTDNNFILRETSGDEYYENGNTIQGYLRNL